MSNLQTRMVALGDADGDGDLDGFTANENGHDNKVWLNDSRGFFTDSGFDLGQLESHHVDLGDLDGDGDLDVFYAMKRVGSANDVLLNKGCFFVISTDPINAAINVSAASVVTVTFNNPVNPATVNANTFSVQGDQHGLYQGQFIEPISNSDKPLADAGYVSGQAPVEEEYLEGISLDGQRRQSRNPLVSKGMRRRSRSSCVGLADT